MAGAAAGLALLAATAALSAGLIVLLRPLLQRYAMARPNARSSHTAPTPQGAGIAVIAAALAGTVAMSFTQTFYLSASGTQLLPFVLAILGLAVIGFIDDIRPLSPRLRLLGQAAAAATLLLALPEGARALPFLALALEAVICLVGLVWFVNLTNFMDGIDGMTVAGFVPALAGLAVLNAVTTPPATLDAIIAVALAGALLGFLPFNRHVAQVFLGDVGSLAIGGMAGYLLLSLATSGRLIAALILPLYYLADASVTLYLRWRRSERLSQAHRDHFYQQAMRRGQTVPSIIARVWQLDLALAVLALLAGTTVQMGLQLLCLAFAAALTAATLSDFGRRMALPAPKSQSLSD
jgi:UDP-N-acetylmuramyl pentapeptide phosphotransferase/UDP-N-acetylglucosamine-1-phosphate transferase